MSDFEPKPLFNDSVGPKQNKAPQKSDKLSDLVGPIDPKDPPTVFIPQAIQFQDKPKAKKADHEGPKPLFTDGTIKEQNDFKLTSEMLAPYEPLDGAQVFIIEHLIKNIDFTRSNKILNYGSQFQEESNIVTDQMLELINNDKMDDIRTKMKEILHLIEAVDIGNATKKGLFDNFFKVDKVEQLKSRFNHSWSSIDSLIKQVSPKTKELETFLNSSNTVLSAIGLNLMKLKSAIIAGKIYIEYYKNVKLEEAKASVNGDLIKAQKVKEMENMLSFFEKRLYDLELSQVSLTQSIPQLELIKNNHFKLVTRMQSTLTMTIPLWKKQYLTALLVLENNKTDQVDQSINNVIDTQKQLIDSLKEI